MKFLSLNAVYFIVGTLITIQFVQTSAQSIRKYKFSSQSNFDEYLKAIDVGMIKRSSISHTKPDVIVETNGRGDYKITLITSLKTIKISFILGKQFEADVGFDTINYYLASLANENEIVLQNLDNQSASIGFKFTDNQLEIVYRANGVTGQRVFSRA
jgi:fatty acid-binding protein 3